VAGLNYEGRSKRISKRSVEKKPNILSRRRDLRGHGKTELRQTVKKRPSVYRYSIDRPLLSALCFIGLGLVPP